MFSVVVVILVTGMGPYLMMHNEAILWCNRRVPSPPPPPPGQPTVWLNVETGALCLILEVGLVCTIVQSCVNEYAHRFQNQSGSRRQIMFFVAFSVLFLSITVNSTQSNLRILDAWNIQPTWPLQLICYEKLFFSKTATLFRITVDNVTCFNEIILPQDCAIKSNRFNNLTMITYKCTHIQQWSQYQTVKFLNLFQIKYKFRCWKYKQFLVKTT